MRPVRRVLVVEPYGIGDLLFLTPVFRALRLLPGIERVDLVLGSRTEAVVRGNPHVDSIFCIDKDLFHRRSWHGNAAEILRLTRILRSRRYDLLLDFSQRHEYGLWGILLGIPVRAGLDYRGRGRFLTHKVRIPGGFSGKHVVDFYAEVAESAGVPVEDRFLEYYVRDEDAEEAAGVLERQGIETPFCVIAPGGGESWGKDAHFKRWPAWFFGAFAARVLPELGFRAGVILGSPGEREFGDSVASALTGIRVWNACGVLPFRQSAAVLARASLFVGNDGGLLHLARALRIPAAGFYGPADPQEYGPYPPDRSALAIVKHGLACRPCYRKFRYRSDCVHRDCLQSLTPEEAVQQFWESPLAEIPAGSFEERP